MTSEQLQFIQFMDLLNNPSYKILFFIFIVWISVWKAIALWRAAKNRSIPWFIALLLINTVGILEITYIFYFSNKKSGQKEIK